MKKFYRIAGIEFELDIPDDKAYKEEGNLASFSVDTVTAPHRFQYVIADELDETFGVHVFTAPSFQIYEDGQRNVRYIGEVAQDLENAYIRTEHNGMEHFVQMSSKTFTRKFGVRSVLKAMDLEHLITQNQGIILHSSYIEYKGNAILFTAPSETGKSTQAGLWEMYRGAEIINGDRACIRICEEQIIADGVPFSGGSGICKNRKLPLAAVVYLGKAEETSIYRLNGVQAFSRIWEGCTINTWDMDDMTIASDVVSSIVKRIPVYYLTCTPDITAVNTLHNQLELEKII